MRRFVIGSLLAIPLAVLVINGGDSWSPEGAPALPVAQSDFIISYPMQTGVVCGTIDKRAGVTSSESVVHFAGPDGQIVSYNVDLDAINASCAQNGIITEP
jgi:hypothetical protein